MEEGEPDPNELFADLGMLIVEGRKPEDSIKGRREGEHCPPLIGMPLHQCIPGNTKCHTMNMVRSHINYMFNNNIPMSIEVLQYPDCCQSSLEEVAIGADASFSSEQPCLLLEQWIIQVLPRRSLHYHQSSRMLLQAIRSYLHFSQLSSWLSMNSGKEPKNITYRVSAPGEAFPANFVKIPEVHSFPAVNITKSSCIRVSVAYLPRQQQIPIIPCGVGHKKMKFSCQHSQEKPFDNSETRFQSEQGRQFRCKRGSGRKCFEKRTRFNAHSEYNVGHSSRQQEKNVHKLDPESYQNAKKHKRKCNVPLNTPKRTVGHRTQECNERFDKSVNCEDQRTRSVNIMPYRNIPDNKSKPAYKDDTCPPVLSQGVETELSSKELRTQTGIDTSENCVIANKNRNVLEDKGIYFVANSDDELQNESPPLTELLPSCINEPETVSSSLDNIPVVQCDLPVVQKVTNVSHNIISPVSHTSLTHKQSSSSATESFPSQSSPPGESQSPPQSGSPGDFKSTTFINSVQKLVSDIKTKLDFASDEEMSPSISRSSPTISAINLDQNAESKQSMSDSLKLSMKRGNQASGQAFHSDPQTSFQPAPEKSRQERNTPRGFIPVFTKSKSLFKSVIQKEPTPKPANENSFERSKTWSSPEPKRHHSRSIDSSGSYIFNPRTGLPLNSSPAPMRKTKESTDDSSLNSRPTTMLKSSTSCNDLGHTLTPMNQSTRVLSTSAPASTSCLLGSFEESVLNGRMEPLGTIEGFSAEIGASGRFCPSHVKLPVTAFFYSVTDDDQPSSYMGYVNLESIGKRGYHVPAQGTIQVTLFNPNGTVVKIFVVRYNLSDMPPNCQTFCRQRVFYMPSNANINDDCEKELRYLLHLRFQSSKSSRIYLHTDIRMIFARHRPDLESGIATYELRSFTEMPSNPRFSPKK
ncbi:protein FAM214A-like [Anneissia japonica]|uniref:protein FAM214A-like n=1 Tax=Anneissia japonica TaxID=1529436 RepID=UPI001425923B|nr:protein FAM214A-like [Anneissia japonica]XP_033105764.1 protein FAM214A-like [Anneissia japonica]